VRWVFGGGFRPHPMEGRPPVACFLSPRTQMIVLWRGNEADSFRPATSSHLGAGLADIIRYRYPPSKRWAIVDRPCGAGGADARVFGRQPKSADRRLPLRGGWGRRKRTEPATRVRRTTDNSPAIHRWAIGATHRTSPVRDDRGAVGTRLCAAAAFRPHAARVVRRAQGLVSGNLCA
jgi:hypothetical protein